MNFYLRKGDYLSDKIKIGKYVHEGILPLWTFELYDYLYFWGLEFSISCCESNSPVFYILDMKSNLRELVIKKCEKMGLVLIAERKYENENFIFKIKTKN